jgi:hypothetical protein
MQILRLAATGTALLVLAGCGDAGTITDPQPTAAAVRDRSSDLSASRARKVQASGRFAAVVDFTTLTLTPRGRNCLLQVDGRLNFTGTIVGSAVGQTTALVFASCSDVAANPPGAFRDVFKSELVFNGMVDGKPARANVLYMGRVQPGGEGEIEGRILFSRGVQGRLEVDETRVAVGGAYRGSVVIR